MRLMQPPQRAGPTNPATVITSRRRDMSSRPLKFSRGSVYTSANQFAHWVSQPTGSGTSCAL